MLVGSGGCKVVVDSFGYSVGASVTAFVGFVGLGREVVFLVVPGGCDEVVDISGCLVGSFIGLVGPGRGVIILVGRAVLVS